MALTVKDMAFAAGIIAGKTIVDAAMDAGYAESTAYKKAHTWVGNSRNESTKPELYDYIQKKRKALEDEFDVSAKEVLKGMHTIATSDIADLFDEDGNMLPPHKLPKRLRAAIVGIEIIERTTGKGKNRKVIGRKYKYKLAGDKNAAWANIAKLQGYNAPEKIEHGGEALTSVFLQFLKQTSTKK
jgi:phage terminase small subunit